MGKVLPREGMLGAKVQEQDREGHLWGAKSQGDRTKERQT